LSLRKIVEVQRLFDVFEDQYCDRNSQKDRIDPKGT